MTAEQTALLLHAYADQRAELSYRRARESEIFLWSSGLLLAITGALLVAQPEHRALLRAGWGAGAFVTLVVVVGLTLGSLRWQRKQRELGARHQEVLARIADYLRLFDSIDGRPQLYPDKWRSWGARGKDSASQLHEPSRIFATFALGLTALISLLLAILVAAS